MEEIFKYINSSVIPAPLSDKWYAVHDHAAVRTQPVEQPACESLSWVVFDGPISDCWIDRLHTLIGPMKALTLNTGETLSLPSNTHLIFEVIVLN